MSFKKLFWFALAGLLPLPFIFGIITVVVLGSISTTDVQVFASAGLALLGLGCYCIGDLIDECNN